VSFLSAQLPVSPASVSLNSHHIIISAVKPVWSVNCPCQPHCCFWFLVNCQPCQIVSSVRRLSSPSPVSQLSLFASSRWPPCRSRAAVSLDAVSLVSYCQLRCDPVVVPSPRPRLVSICHFRQPPCQLSVLSIISSVELPVSFSSPGPFVVCPLHCIASVLVSYQSPQMFLSSLYASVG
jgi:hypothetical protein